MSATHAETLPATRDRNASQQAGVTRQAATRGEQLSNKAIWAVLGAIL